MQDQITSSKLEELTQRLVGFSHTIKGLVGVRDKWIAHTDQLGGIAPWEGFFPRTAILIDFAFEVLDICSMAVWQKPVYNTRQTTTVNGFALIKEGYEVRADDHAKLL